MDSTAFALGAVGQDGLGAEALFSTRCSPVEVNVTLVLLTRDERGERG